MSSIYLALSTQVSRLNLLVTLVQTVMFYEMLVGINALKEISLFSTTPHEGNLRRTYYKPEETDTI